MPMHPTAYLEHYADIYSANMLYKHGVKLDAYLAEPARYEHLLTAPFPLLPVQTSTRVRLIRDEALQLGPRETDEELGAFLENEVRPFERLRHHRHPKRRGFASSFKRSRHAQPLTT
ncbi:hypothetical protein [Marinobacter sp.]|uniref:hypothetical protein n=1 Tax=Marinobacter sp. TaxID=50741 RepID=UPI0034A5AE19